MKILYLKAYKWLLSENQQVRNDVFDYRQCEARGIVFFIKTIN